MPNLTLVTLTKLWPVMVTVVPPALGPAAGLRCATTGRLLAKAELGKAKPRMSIAATARPTTRGARFRALFDITTSPWVPSQRS